MTRFWLKRIMPPQKPRRSGGQTIETMMSLSMLDHQPIRLPEICEEGGDGGGAR